MMVRIIAVMVRDVAAKNNDVVEIALNHVVVHIRKNAGARNLVLGATNYFADCGSGDNFDYI